MSTSRLVEILIATGNPGKAREIEAVLGESRASPVAPVEIHWKTLSDLPDPIHEPVETGDTFAANATLKSRYYARATGLWTLADDSGLVVDALDGAPGVFSARYADLPEGSSRRRRDEATNRKLIERLQGVPAEQRTARFRCVLALTDGDRVLATAEGAIEGRIIDEPRGEGGFGYDPHFLVPELGRTTAELRPDHKNRISHRGQALRAMQDAMDKLFLEVFG